MKTACQLWRISCLDFGPSQRGQLFNVSCELSGAFYPLAEATHGTKTDRQGRCRPNA